MDNKEFTQKALRWQELQEEAAKIAAELEAETLARGKTQTVGDVRVTYSNPRKSYDYRGAAEGSPMVTEAMVVLFTEPSVDWRGVCKYAGIEVEGVASGEPSAKIKLLA